MIRFLSKGARPCSLILFALTGLLTAQSALAANYYVGGDGACDQSRLDFALLAAAVAADPNPVFYIARNKPAAVAEIVVAYGALQTAEFRGGYNTCQDAINGVAPTGRSAIHSNAMATSANRRVMRIGSASNSPTVRFYDITISGGRLNSTVIPTAYGAGLFIDYGTVQMFRSWVEGNWTNPANTQSRGGGVAVRGSGRFLSIDAGTVIRDNTAYDGGGIYCANSATMLMEGSDIRDNRANRGAGLHVTGGCNAPLTSTASSNGRVRNNQLIGTGTPVGAGIYVGTNSLVTLIGTSARRFQLTGNTGNGSGGGAYVEGNQALLDANWTDFDNNQVGAGGGMTCRATNGELGITAQNVRVRNNTASGATGGGVFVIGGCRVRLFNGVTISGNTRTGGGTNAGGGGIAVNAVTGDATLTIEGGSQAATIVGNSSPLGGGAFVTAGNGNQGRINLDNVVVSNNTATDWGGGLYAVNSGAEIIMRRTLAGSACHSQFYCSDLSFNVLDASIPDRGAAAAARDGGKIEIWGTYIEGNQGTALRAVNLSSGNGGIMNVGSSVMVPISNRPMLRADQASVQLYYNTIDHAGSSSVPITLFDGNSSDRRSFFYGNLFNGSVEPLSSGNINWYAIGNNGCAGFSQTHAGNAFFSAHAAVRRFVGPLPLTSGTRLINDPTHPIIDFCDADLAMNPGIDILGNSRPHNTANPNTHGTFDLGAHEIRIPPLFNLDASRTGQGSLASAPAGISCPGTCTATFAENTNVQVTATPDAGWAFSHWDGNCSGTNPVCNVVMSANRTVVARFIEESNEDIIFQDRFQ
ncbi:MAG: right-handed parallel beta-helix repeat-containing protein [Wenzhouxiangella sp.]|nr:right-handed parallel beta-helix repeat-containing protein [Wenzhouxiangella sp.]